MISRGENISLSARRLVTVHLQKIPLLVGVDEETLNQVAKTLQIRSVKRGTPVLLKGSVGDHLMFLLSGRLQVSDLTEDGREVGLNFLSPGDYFGELSILDGLPRSASVFACETSLVASLPRPQALRLLYQTPLVSERLMKGMATSIRKAAQFRAILSVPNAFQRVFLLLNEFSQITPDGLVVIERMPTQQEIAIMANTSRESVSRSLRSLLQNKVIKKDVRRLIIIKPAVLCQAVTRSCC